jgi:muramidase (phage lysozyme)
MATDNERLVVELEARIRDFEKNMEKASRTAAKEFGSIEDRGKKASQKVEGLFSKIGSNISNSIGGGFVAGGLAGLISAGTLETLGSMVKSVADMADEAQRINLPVEDFQALVYNARQAGLEQSNVTDLFQKFQLAVGEGVAKGNDLQQILEANGIQLVDTNGKIRTQQELFYDVVNLIKNAKTQQEAALIANAAFGKSAKDALPWLQQGADAIREGEQAARDAGAVMDEELVKRAAKFDDEFTAAWDSFKAHAKSAILETMVFVADLGIAIDKAIGKSGLRSRDLRGNDTIPGLNGSLIKGLEGVFPSLKDGSETLALEERKNAIIKERAEIQKEVQDALNRGDNGDFVQFQNQKWQELGVVLDETVKKLEAIHALNNKEVFGPSFTSGHDGKMPPTVSEKIVKLTIIPKLGGKSQSEADAKLLERATKGGILDLIGFSEGTDKGRGYNEVLGYGAYGGGSANLTSMTLKEIQVLQQQIRKNPKNPYNSGAVGRYQIVGTTLKGLMKDLNLSGDELYDEKMQDKLASVLATRRGNNPKGLRSEWQSFEKLNDKTITDAFGNSSHVIETGTAAIHARDDAMKKLTATQRSEIQGLEVERRAMGMSFFEGERYKKQQELLAQAKAAGIPITASTRQNIDKLATAYAAGKTKIEQFRLAQVEQARSAREVQKANEQAAQSYAKMGDTFASATKGFLQDLMDGKSGAEALQNALKNLASQAMNMAVDSIFKGIFSGGGAGKMGGGGAGKAGGAAMALGFADGGHVRGAGSGTSDSIPAMLSNGEFVINSEATKKNHVLLEAINSGKVLKFAQGGLMGVGVKAIPNPSIAANDNSSQSISINNNVTVNATGGSKEQNHDMARQIGLQVEASVKNQVLKELRNQRRPGNMMGKSR